ncbi:spore germination protein [Paenibacillus sp. P25]|nr:spore germination protein [Paenibacillus sp. P25]
MHGSVDRAFGKPLDLAPAALSSDRAESLFFIHLAACDIRDYCDFLLQMYLPTTPMWAVAGLFSFTVAIAVRLGLETIFRCGAGFSFILFGTVFLAPFMVGKELEMDRAIALITHFNAAQLWDATYSTTPWFAESFLVLFLWPQIKDAHKTFRTPLYSSLFSGAFVAVNFIMCMLLFGPNITQHMPFPVLELIRYIRIGDFLENMDPFIVAIWTTSIFLKVCLLLYTAVLIMAQMLKLKDLRPLTFSMAAIMMAMSAHIAVSTSGLHQFYQTSWPTYTLFVECLPAIYILSSYVRRKRSAAASP